jgi:membrane-associated phospholipid phosphatase
MLGTVPTTLCLLTLSALLASTPVPAGAMPQAQQASDAPTVHPLAFDWTRDGLIAGVSGALWIGSEAFLKKQLAPKTCRWCDRAEDGTDTLNAVDRWGRGVAGRTEEEREHWALASDITDFAVLPVAVFGGHYLLASGSGALPGVYAQDATILLEAATLAALTNQVVKFTVGRERPFVHVLPEDQKGLTEKPLDNNVSFYSGHTSLAFSLVTAAGTVSELRGYRHRWLIWAVGLPVASSVALMRMGADKHYFTDVLVGAVVGSAFGVGVPLLMHGRQPQETSRQSSRMSLGVTGSANSIVLSGQF